MTRKTGFQLLTPDQLRAVASKGGAAPKARGFDNPDTARRAALARWNKGVDSGKASAQSE